MRRRKLITALAATAVFGAAASPVHAELRRVKVTLVTGQQLTLAVDVPPGTPIDQVAFILLAAFLATSSLLLLSWAYARAQASYLATTEYTSFLWAALFGWLIFKETLSSYTVAGAVMIVAGCILAARRPEEASPTLEAAT